MQLKLSLVVLAIFLATEASAAALPAVMTNKPHAYLERRAADEIESGLSAEDDSSNLQRRSDVASYEGAAAPAHLQKRFFREHKLATAAVLGGGLLLFRKWNKNRKAQNDAYQQQQQQLQQQQMQQQQQTGTTQAPAVPPGIDPATGAPLQRRGLPEEEGQGQGKNQLHRRSLAEQGEEEEEGELQRRGEPTERTRDNTVHGDVHPRYKDDDVKGIKHPRYTDNNVEGVKHPRYTDNSIEGESYLRQENAELQRREILPETEAGDVAGVVQKRSFGLEDEMEEPEFERRSFAEGEEEEPAFEKRSLAEDDEDADDATLVARRDLEDDDELGKRGLIGTVGGMYLGNKLAKNQGLGRGKRFLATIAGGWAGNKGQQYLTGKHDKHDKDD